MWVGLAPCVYWNATAYGYFCRTFWDHWTIYFCVCFFYVAVVDISGHCNDFNFSFDSGFVTKITSNVRLKRFRNTGKNERNEKPTILLVWYAYHLKLICHKLMNINQCLHFMYLLWRSVCITRCGSPNGIVIFQIAFDSIWHANYHIHNKNYTQSRPISNWIGFMTNCVPFRNPFLAHIKIGNSFVCFSIFFSSPSTLSYLFNMSMFIYG
jgi:hypothetical protein